MGKLRLVKHLRKLLCDYLNIRVFFNHGSYKVHTLYVLRKAYSEDFQELQGLHAMLVYVVS